VGPGDSVLEIGCGTGRNLIVAARRYPLARFFGIDISSVMLGSAMTAIGRARLSSRIVVARADATRFDPLDLFGEQQFARVFSSYSLSMIPAWPTVLDSALRLLAAGGELHVIDFGRQEHLPSWFGTGLRSWLRLFEVAPRDDLERTLIFLGEELGARVTVERPYGGYAQYAIVRRR
jgi:S-adenosylmethionine-diacylgycerolhomoserine-N-methlytransferase